MAWTTPKTWNVGDILTAADLNTYVRDNFNATAVAQVTTAGDTVYATGSKALSRLALGTARQYLSVNAGATAPAWFSPPACDVYSTASQSINNTTWTAVTFGSENVDTDSMHSTTANTGRITINTAGKYLLIAFAAMDPNITGERDIAIYTSEGGGASAAKIQTTWSAESNAGSLGVNMEVVLLRNLAVNDYAEVYVYQSSGGALNVNSPARFQAIWVAP